MSRICPQCSQTNQDDTTFCRFCGYRFQGDEQAVDLESTIRPGSLASVPSNADPGSTLKTGDQSAQAAQPAPIMATPQPQPQAAQSAPLYPPSVATPNPAQQQAPYMPPPAQQGAYMGQPAPAYGQAPYGAPAMAPGAGSSSLARAFAEKGTPVHHQSWLLDGRQVHPANLRNSLLENVQRQGVMGVTASFERLREQGVMMEERDYVRVQYGISSIFVYMAPMGQNLYISRTSTVRQPYSTLRMIVLGGLFVLMLISLIVMIIVSASASLSTSGFVDDIGTFFSYAFYGLLFYFIYLVLRSLLFLLTDKDFLAFLRPNRLNDFTLDTLSSIEKITDKAIRDTVRQAGLNAEEITPAAQSYAPQQPLHRF